MGSFHPAVIKIGIPTLSSIPFKPILKGFDPKIKIKRDQSCPWVFPRAGHGPDPMRIGPVYHQTPMETQPRPLVGGRGVVFTPPRLF